MNPKCNYTKLKGQKCQGTLHRQKSGRRSLLVCSDNKKHTYPVGAVILPKKEQI